MNQDFHTSSRQVLHLAHLDFTLLRSLQDRVDERTRMLRRTRRLAERNLRDGKRLVVALLNLRTHTHHPTTLTVVVLAHVDASTRREVRIELERLVVEIIHRSITDFIEIMRENLARKTHGNAFSTLCQQQRELHRQGDRLLVASVVTQFPFRRLRIENHVERELRKTSLDVSTRSSIVTRQDIAPVALAVNQQFLLPQLHQRILDTRITMRMILHRATHDVRHLIISAIVHLLHRMEDTSLHRLESVHDMRHGTLQNHV